MARTHRDGHDWDEDDRDEEEAQEDAEGAEDEDEDTPGGSDEDGAPTRTVYVIQPQFVDVDGDGQADFFFDRLDSYTGADANGDGQIDGTEGWTQMSMDEIDYLALISLTDTTPDADTFFGSDNEYNGVVLDPSNRIDEERDLYFGGGSGEGGDFL